MALNVKFWTFSKVENSTAIPGAVALEVYTDVILKEACSVVNPAIQLQAPMTTNVHRWNYCYITDFLRYYYVSDWIWDGGLWTAELEVDVLASWATQIGQQRLYVTRAAYLADKVTVAAGGNVIDTTYPATAAQATFNSSAVNNPFYLNVGLDTFDGAYIVGIVNSAATNGSVTYYAFNKAGFRLFCSKLYTYSSGWLDIDVTEISEDLQKALVNPFQYVVSCFYLPVSVTWFTNNNIGTAVTDIYFGWWSVNVSVGARIVPYNTLYNFTTSLSIPKHPQAATRGNYLNLSPYTYYTLRYYPFGTIDIDTEALAGWSTLDLYTDLDVCTGKAVLTIAVNGKNNPLRTIEANIAVQIPTAAVNVDFMSLGTKSTGIAAAAAAVSEVSSGPGGFFQNIGARAKAFIGNVRTGNWSQIGSNIKQSVSNIASAAMASKATVELTGQQGTYSIYGTQTLTLSGRFLPVVDEDFTHRGRPLCEVKQINALYGFVQCADADVTIPCTDREKSAIKAYLESGIYYYG